MKHLVGWWMVSLLSVASSAAANGDLRLVEAVKNQDKAAVRALLSQKADVNVPQPDGATALHWAAQWDDLDTADLLIRAGAHVDAADDYGVTALSLACTNGNAAMVEKLLKAGANPKGALPTGETVLMTAARTGILDVVNALLNHGADVNAKDASQGQTALMWASAESHAQVVRLLIEHGAEVRGRSKAGFTPLLFAARDADLNTIQLLLAAGADVNEAAPDGTTALVVATIRGHTASAKFLLDQGADANKGPGFTPLHWAVGDWNRDVAASKVTTDATEWSAFSGLRGQEKLDFVKVLLAHGADPNTRAKRNPTYTGGRIGGGASSEGTATISADAAHIVERSRFDAGNLVGGTPFLMAAMAADTSVMRVLVASGADPSLMTNQRTTPLMVAAGVGRNPGDTPIPEPNALDAVKLCVELGADVNAANALGETALHGAAYRAQGGANTIVQFLVDKGANVNVKNKRGWSPFTIAEGLYFDATNSFAPGTAELLRKLGAEPSPPGLERDTTAVDLTEVAR